MDWHQRPVVKQIRDAVKKWHIEIILVAPFVMLTAVTILAGLPTQHQTGGPRAPVRRVATVPVPPPKPSPATEPVHAASPQPAPAPAGAEARLDFAPSEQNATAAPAAPSGPPSGPRRPLIPRWIMSNWACPNCPDDRMSLTRWPSSAKPCLKILFCRNPGISPFRADTTGSWVGAMGCRVPLGMDARPAWESRRLGLCWHPTKWRMTIWCRLSPDFGPPKPIRLRWQQFLARQR